MDLENLGVPASHWIAHETTTFLSDDPRALVMLDEAVALEGRLLNAWRQWRLYNRSRPEDTLEKIDELQCYVFGLEGMRRVAAARHGQRTRPYSLSLHEGLVKEIDQIGPTPMWRTHARAECGSRVFEQLVKQISQWRLLCVMNYENMV